MNKIFLILVAIYLPMMISAQTDIEAKIDSIIQADSYVVQKPGLSICIVKDGKILFSKGYGLANLEYDIKNTNTSVFDIASMAKQFTAACIWTLIDKEQLSLDDDIRKYLPEIPDFGDTIRIRHMLNHTSGLRNYSSILDLAGYNYLEHFFNNQSILELMSRQNGLNNKPGEKMIYGNTPFNLLTIIVERISGMKFKDFADQNIFIPLGMNSTSYRVDNTSIVKNRAVGYIMDKDSTFSQFSRIESCYGGGSLWSTVEDLSSWSNLFTQPTKEYKDLVEFLLTKDTLKYGQTSNYSRGLNVDMYKGHNTIHHGGMTKGYRSQIITIPDIQLSVIILANYNSVNPESLSYKIVDMFINNSEIKQESFVPYKHKPKELRELIGVYQELNSCLKMEVIFKNDTLFAKSSLGRNFVPLRSMNQKTLCRFDNESVKYVFDKQLGSDLLVYFGATPFYFEKVTLVEPSGIRTDDYLGEYYSEELDVNYQVYKEEDDLFLSYPNNPRIKLIAGQKDEFGNGYRTKYTFFRNENDRVDRLKVASEGTVKDIEFKIISISACDGTKNMTEIEPVENTQTEFKLAESDFVILPFNKDWHWIFKNVEPTELTQSELIEIENILKIAVKVNNERQKVNLKKHNDEYPKNKWSETGFELKLKGKKRQYVPVINEKGEKEIWINFFCNDWDSDSWKKDLMIVHDGGNCYFNLKVNLTNKTYSDLEINGYA